MIEVLNEIKERRQHHISVGRTAEHDDEHTDGSILSAAICYALLAAGNRDSAISGYPWDNRGWLKKDRRNLLIDAAAMIMAEVERGDRALPWKWWATYDEENFDYGPFDTREEAIAAMLADDSGLFEDGIVVEAKFVTSHLDPEMYRFLQTRSREEIDIKALRRAA